MGLSPNELAKVFADLAAVTATTQAQQNAASAVNDTVQGGLRADYEKEQKEKQKKAKKSALFSTIGRTVGSIFGGPIGATVGQAAGNQLGGGTDSSFFEDLAGYGLQNVAPVVADVGGNFLAKAVDNYGVSPIAKANADLLGLPAAALRGPSKAQIGQLGQVGDGVTVADQMNEMLLSNYEKTPRGKLSAALKGGDFFSGVADMFQYEPTASAARIPMGLESGTLDSIRQSARADQELSLRGNELKSRNAREDKASARADVAQQLDVSKFADDLSRWKEGKDLRSMQLENSILANEATSLALQDYESPEQKRLREDSSAISVANAKRMFEIDNPLPKEGNEYITPLIGADGEVYGFNNRTGGVKPVEGLPKGGVEKPGTQKDDSDVMKEPPLVASIRRAMADVSAETDPFEREKAIGRLKALDSSLKPEQRVITNQYINNYDLGMQSILNGVNMDSPKLTPAPNGEKPARITIDANGVPIITRK